jgi:hypothetical protein
MCLGRFSVGVLVEDRYPSVVSCNETAGCIGTCILHELSAPRTCHYSDFTAICYSPMDGGDEGAAPLDRSRGEYTYRANSSTVACP